MLSGYVRCSQVLYVTLLTGHRQQAPPVVRLFSCGRLCILIRISCFRFTVYGGLSMKPYVQLINLYEQKVPVNVKIFSLFYL